MGRPRGGRGAGRGRGRATVREAPLSESLPPIKKPSALFGLQLGVPGSYWQGRMSTDERNTIYLCTVREFDAVHRWSAEEGSGAVTRPPSRAWQLQEMGPTGSGSLEEGDASGEIFWMDHEDFVLYYYRTFPPAAHEDEARVEDGLTNEEECIAVDDEDGGDREAAAKGDDSTGEPDKAAPIYKFWKLESDTLIQLGKDAGLYLSKYSCKIVCEKGMQCGAPRTIRHKFGKYGINSNLHSHIGERAKQGCPSHIAALAELDETNASKGVDEDGNVVKKMNFAESFAHHVHATWLRAAGLATGGSKA